MPVYEGRAKQCNVSRLQPSTLYKFRVAAVSELGSSLYSEIISYATQVSNISSYPNFSEIDGYNYIFIYIHFETSEFLKILHN